MSRAFEWLSPLDAGFLQIERDTQQMHVGSVLVFDGPVPAYEDYCEQVAARLDAVPRYRQRVQRPPMDVARPYWVDDPHFSIHYHVRHTAIPHPGGEEQLRTLASRIQSQRLDLDRPLWEMWLVEGLSGNRFAVINKAHHAMIDGVSGHEVLEILLDREEQAEPVAASRWRPRPAPSRTDLLREAATWTVRLPAQAGRALGSAVSSPASTVRGGATRAVGIARSGRTVSRGSGVLNGPLGPHRRWSWARGDLADVKTVKSAVGCTVNDVVLAAIAGAFRTFLLAQGEDVDTETVRSLVPVSVRRPEQRGRLGNQVSAMFADLPVGIADPLGRLAAVAEQMDQLKGSGQAVGVASMVSAAEFVPPTLMTLGARVTAAVGPRWFNTVTTNIPGPQYPIYLMGSRLLEMFPYIPVADGARISIGIVSYNGSMAFGVSADYDAVPDLDALSTAIEDSLAELVAAVATT